MDSGSGESDSSSISVGVEESLESADMTAGKPHPKTDPSRKSEAAEARLVLLRTEEFRAIERQQRALQLRARFLEFDDLVEFLVRHPDLKDNFYQMCEFRWAYMAHFTKPGIKKLVTLMESKNLFEVLPEESTTEHKPSTSTSRRLEETGDN